MENKDLVVETTENVEVTTEETPKMYTQEEVNDIVGKRIARTESKMRKEYDRKYGDLMDVLKAGTGKESVEEVKDTFQKFYTSKGVKMPEKPMYTDKDIAVLAKAEAEEIIRGGFEDVVDETERLQKMGANRNAREEAVYKALAKHLQEDERSRELSKLGVAEEVYNSKEFQEFAGKFNPNTPISDVYNIYKQTQPKKEHFTLGSMKNNNPGDVVVKEYYSPEEAKKIKPSDYDRIPGLHEAVVNSMAKWRK
jgi:hypothetical protein